MRNNWFDEVTHFNNFDDDSNTVVWSKGGKEVKRLKVFPSMKAPYCPACLMYRAELVPMTGSKKFLCVSEYCTNEQPFDSFTKLQCPECKGLFEDTGCTCGEAPHRARCPMGFLLYFQNEVFDVRQKERNLWK